MHAHVFGEVLFLKLASKNNLIVRGKVISYHDKVGVLSTHQGKPDHYLTMDFEINEVLKGELKQEKIRIRGDNGAQCFRYIMNFPIGTEWVFILPDWKASSDPDQKYVALACGEYQVKVEGEEVIGKINVSAGYDSPDVRIKLADLKKSL